MARCTSCFGDLAKTGAAGCVCGQPAGKTSQAWRYLFRIWAEPKSPLEYVKAKNAILNRVTPGSYSNGMNVA